MAEGKEVPAQAAGDREIAEFLRAVAATPAPMARAGGRGRLLFAMDATASREPTWDRAARIQGEMFEATARIGGLDVQLVFYRGFNECRASPWMSSAADLLKRMTLVRCRAGQTQIGRVLAHAARENGRARVNAVVFVGDCFEEDLDHVAQTAGELGLAGVPVFIFHEGDDAVARRAFQSIARLSGGACCRFDSSSAAELADLLRAVAVFAAGGRPALEDHANTRGGIVRLLTSQLGSRGGTG